MSLEANLIQRFREFTELPPECQLERRLIQQKVCLMVDCPNGAIANQLWRNQSSLAAALEILAMGDRCIILCQGKVWHPAFHDR